MARIFFAREGNNPNRSNQGQHVKMETILKHFSKTQKKHFGSAPLINVHKEISPYSSYTLSVVEVDDDETNKIFPNPGFYLLQNISPGECSKLLNFSLS